MLCFFHCSLCNCSAAGSVKMSCDITNGICECKRNVQGTKCDDCNVNSFNLMSSNPDGCQDCFCYGHSTTCESAPGHIGNTIESDEYERLISHKIAPCNCLHVQN